MNNINDYLKITKSAVVKLFDAHYSYWKLMEEPERPIFTFLGKADTEEYRLAYEKWREEKKEILDERIKRDNEFAYEYFSRATLMGTILQFAFWGIEKYSNNETISEEFQDLIKPTSKAKKYCIGRKYEEIPIGLIIYAGRNQAMHFDDSNLHPISKRVFDRLANWYSPRFKKWYKSDYFNLDNPNILNYAENITYILGWRNYELYEMDMKQMLNAK